MSNRTIDAYKEVLNIAVREIDASQSSTQIVGVFEFDAKRQAALLAEASKLMEIRVCDTPETHPDVLQQ